jgi:broad specificity phosphatase PhoE
MKVILLRHAESKKNLSHTIGGSGAPLTSRGRLCSMHTADRIRSLRPIPSHIYCAPTVQTHATSEYIKARLPECELSYTLLLAPINLGHLSGSTVAQAQRSHPADMNTLTAWNRGLIDIASISIEGMQSPWSFYRNGLLFILAIKKVTDCAIVVATRSSLILLWHIKHRRTPDPGDGYKNKLFPYHKPITLDFKAQDFAWVRRQLKRSRTLKSSAS